MKQEIAIAKIRLDGGTQSRAEIDEGTVAEYAEALSDGATFPPIDVFFDGTDYWCADGFHRTLAAKRAKRKAIPCNVHQGDRRAATLRSAGANALHGKRRTNADKRRAVTKLLSDEEWIKRSDRWIAEQCVVGHVFVSNMRKELFTVNSSKPRTGRDGKARKAPKPTASQPPTKPATPASAPSAASQSPAPAPAPAPEEEEEEFAEVPSDAGRAFVEMLCRRWPPAVDPEDAASALLGILTQLYCEWPTGVSYEPIYEVLQAQLPFFSPKKGRGGRIAS